MKTNAFPMSVFLLAAASLFAAETVTFPSKDGLSVTADLYMAHPPDAPFVVLFHQADYSRGEYVEIAPRLNKLGFNALAVDQRSGGTANGVQNATAAEARTRRKGRSYIDALPDMEAAIALVRARGYAKGRLLLWGSSYSASLVLKIAGDHPGICDALLCFSPGEYFSEGSDFIARSARNVTVPVFIASGPYEKDDWDALYKAIPSKSKSFYLPAETGRHGSSALWSRMSGSEEYWKAVEAFLEKVGR